MNFHKVFWDKTSADNFWTFVYTEPTVLRYLSVKPNHQKTWHVQRTLTMFKCCNWISSFHHPGQFFLKFWGFGRWAEFYWAVTSEKEVEDRWEWGSIFKVHKFLIAVQIRLECASDSCWRVEIAGEICDQFKLHGESDCPEHTWEIQNCSPFTWYPLLMVQPKPGN